MSVSTVPSRRSGSSSAHRPRAAPGRPARRRPAPALTSSHTAPRCSSTGSGSPPPSRCRPSWASGTAPSPALRGTAGESHWPAGRQGAPPTGRASTAASGGERFPLRRGRAWLSGQNTDFAGASGAAGNRAFSRDSRMQEAVTRVGSVCRRCWRALRPWLGSGSGSPPCGV